MIIKRVVGNPFPIYVSLYSLGRISFALKGYAAGAMWRECLAIVVEHRLKGCIPWALNVLGGLLAAVDTLLNASRLWGAAERLYEEGSEPMNIQVREQIDGQVAAARAALGDDAAFDGAWQEGRAMTLEQAVALAQRETRPT